MGIAQRQPKSPPELRKIRGLDDRHLRGEAAEGVLAAVRDGLARTSEPTEEPEIKELDRDLRPAVALVSAWVSQLSRNLEIDTGLKIRQVLRQTRNQVVHLNPDGREVDQHGQVGNLRLVSHHDLMRLLERLLRRASLPFRSTEGFNPKAKITFASALSLGIIGHEEVVEIELDGDHSAESVIEVLSPLVPDGFRFLSGRSVPVKVTVQPVRAVG